MCKKNNQQKKQKMMMMMTIGTRSVAQKKENRPTDLIDRSTVCNKPIPKQTETILNRNQSEQNSISIMIFITRITVFFHLIFARIRSNVRNARFTFLSKLQKSVAFANLVC